MRNKVGEVLGGSQERLEIFGKKLKDSKNRKRPEKSEKSQESVN